MTAPQGGDPPERKIRLVKPPATGFEDEDQFTLPPDGDMRPQVQIHCDYSVVVDKTIEAWAPREADVYTRAGGLCTVVNAGGQLEAEKMLEPETPRIFPLTTPAVSNRLMRHVRFVRKGPKGWFHCSPPPRLVTELAARGEWTGIRRLMGIAETPFMRRDGTVCQTPGYDVATGFLYTPNADYPPIPDEPRRDDAVAALAALQEPFSDFPFVSPAAALAPVAAIMTMLARPAIRGSIPCFAFDASTKRTGKSRLTDSVAIIATGRSASRASFPEDDVELDKVMSAYALSGSRLIVLDNVTRRFGGGPLDKVLTAIDEVDFRILGRTEIARVLWTAMLMCSGNNLDFGEDTISRSILCRIESPLENPEDRIGFKHDDLLGYLRSERVRLVTAAMTVLRAWTCKGLTPDPEEFKWGGFEKWAELIPPAIVFAGGANVLTARPPKSRVSGDALGALSLIHSYLPKLSETPLTARQIVSSIYPSPRKGEPPDGFDALRDAFEQLGAISKGGQPPTVAVVSRVLTRSIGRVLGVKKLCSTDDGHGTRTFWVQ